MRRTMMGVLVVMRRMFGRGWDVKRTIFAPLAANLLTAGIIFWCVIFFKDAIYAWVTPGEGVEQYPVYCIVEPYNDENGLVVADLFIVNLSGTRKLESDLVAAMKLDSRKEGLAKDPSIRVRWNGGLGGIREIRRADPFNKGKGELAIEAPSDGGETWLIRIEEIAGKAVLKLRVVTDLRRPMSRNAKASLPLEYEYPGR